MARRHRQRAYFERLEMLVRLGGKCAQCGTKGTAKNGLQIDHINGREWDIRKKDPSWRMAIYKQEEKEGKLAVLCARCNNRKH